MADKNDNASASAGESLSEAFSQAAALARVLRMVFGDNDEFDELVKELRGRYPRDAHDINELGKDMKEGAPIVVPKGFATFLITLRGKTGIAVVPDGKVPEEKAFWTKRLDEENKKTAPSEEPTKKRKKCNNDMCSACR